MKYLRFAYNLSRKRLPTPIKRQYVIELMESDGKYCRGKVIARNEWSVMELGDVDIFIVEGFEEISEEDIQDFTFKN